MVLSNNVVAVGVVEVIDAVEIWAAPSLLSSSTACEATLELEVVSNGGVGD